MRVCVHEQECEGLECSPMAPETEVQNPWSNRTKGSKMVLDASLLKTQHYKVRIKGKVGQFWERSSALFHLVLLIHSFAFFDLMAYQPSGVI